MIWCKMRKTKIIGADFFRQSSVDSAAYKSMLRYYGLQHVQQLPGSRILQQDRAPVHTANTAKECLSRKIVNNWNSAAVNCKTQFLFFSLTILF